ncbi:D-alanyl-D-alanine carboxypeptidase family protein [Lactonifactor longoviformis]|uniref:D-alanyl-D-alanine carboxypeptidase family protein n=1 Tax=Lactonifactor longoviformis TaxID=341220 RepID=UPI001D01E1C5|nr:serine hydrolase [Lactonifactor longoviformis]MCB5714073.1 serine hydrolase [Lactonifactor longoviformis]MCB5718096.1 serine hydrolase [Lactonifactor longoviformis]
MKCTDKNRKRTRRELRRRKVRRTIFLSLFLVIVVLAGALSIMMFHKDRALDEVLPYSLQTEVFGKSGDDTSQVAEGMAYNLCVASGDIPLEGITPQNSERSALLDVDGKQVMFSQSMFEKTYPASITKLMTAILALEHGNMNDVVTIEAEDVTLEEGAQLCGFRAGDKVSMDELLHGLLVYSGNDAAMAIARQVGGSVDGFVQMMNEEALRLGATGTHFVNPHGLHDPDHYTTAYDIYLMLNEAITYKEFTTISQMSSYTLTYQKASGEEGRIALEATDKYLTGEISTPKDVTILGGKTGTTSQAGACLAIVSQNAYGKPYISIVLNAKTKSILYDQMTSLLQKINS